MTPTEVNALPERVRRYIHDLEANADPAGMVRANVLLRDENAQLRALVGELQKDAERLDWLDQLSESYGFEDTLEGHEWQIGGPFNTVREALDAAMGAGGEQ